MAPAPNTASPPHAKGDRSRRGSVLFIIVAVVCGAGGAAIFWGTDRGASEDYTTFTVRRGPLEISILEGGNIEALESQEVKSEVRGWQGTKILSIVEEGYYVTEEDVENKLKLVELDSSEYRDKLTTSEITFKGTQASLEETRQGYEIQVNKSESDIYASELEVKFAGLEFEKYLGAKIAADVLRQIQVFEEEVEAVRKAKAEEAQRQAKATVESAVKTLEADLNAEDEALGDGGGAEGGPELPPGMPSEVSPETVELEPAKTLEELRLSHPDISFRKYADSELLGDGEANQQLRKFADELLVAMKERKSSQTDYEGKKRLFDRGFVTQNEFDNAQMDIDKREISVRTAKSAQHNFIEYDFPKEAEKRLSDFIKAKRKLERTERSALSEISRANSKRFSAQARYRIEADRIREYKEQIEHCTMYAKRTGLVVYGGSGPRYWNAEPIKEGATIRERQAIITIPDMSTMAVKVKIHESDIKKVKVGQQARIRADAFPDRPLEGEVIKVAVLPDSEDRWMNPDLKVYETTVKMEGTHDWLKPGMSAETEIVIEKLDDAIYIPIQSVVPVGKKQVCFVVKDGKVESREIETGEVTIEFITVTAGLEAGEEVLIRPPEGSRRDESEGADEGEAPERDEGTGDDDAPGDDAAEDGASESEGEAEGSAAASEGEASDDEADPVEGAVETLAAETPPTE